MVFPYFSYFCNLIYLMANILTIALTLIYLFGIPFLIVKMAERWPVINKISPMVILYIIGLLVGNIGIVGETAFKVCENISNIAMLIAIPLMLLCCNFQLKSAKSIFKAFGIGMLSILTVTVAGFFLFQSQATAAGLTDTEFAKVGAVMVGIYTGGIPNLAPVSKAVGLPQHLFLLVSGHDLVVTSIYLLVIVFLGRRIVQLFFPKKVESHNEIKDVPDEEVGKNKSLKQIVANRGIGILVAIVIVAISYALSLVIPLDNSIAVIIITITTLSILLSFWKPVKRLEGTFETGLYFVYVFCLAVATMVNVHDLEFSKHLFILYYIAFAVFGSLLLQILFSRIFKLDGDLMLASSIALINSPPFVPMVAAVLKNKDIILPGIAIGLLGYAVGNYLGIGMFWLLSHMG